MSDKTNLAIVINNQTVQGNIITIDKATFPIQNKLPHEPHIERKLIGQLISLFLVSSGNIDILNRHAYLSDQDFFDVQMAWIFKAVRTCFEADTISFEHVVGMLKNTAHGNTNQLELIGGAEALFSIGNEVPKLKEMEGFIGVVYNTSIQRQFIVATGILATKASAHTSYSIMSDLLQKAIDTLLKIQSKVMKVTQNSTDTFSDTAIEFFKRFDRERNDPTFETGIKIWIPELQDKLLGWRKNRLYTLAAGTGQGKTFWALNVALNAFKQNKRVCYISLEMDTTELIERMMSLYARIDAENIAKRQMSDEQFANLGKAIQTLTSNRFSALCHMTYLSNPTLVELRAKINDLWLTRGFDILILDYAGVETIASKNAFQKSNEHAQDIWKEMKTISDTFEVPFLCLAQVNRAYMNRGDKRPNKTDISDSSVAEKASDVLMILHRPSTVGDESSPKDYADITIVKNRNGADGRIGLRFNSSYGEFTDEVIHVDLGDLNS